MHHRSGTQVTRPVQALNDYMFISQPLNDKVTLAITEMHLLYFLVQVNRTTCPPPVGSFKGELAKFSTYCFFIKYLNDSFRIFSKLSFQFSLK